MLYFGLLASFVLEYVRPGSYLPAITALKLNTLVPLLVFVVALYSTQKSTNRDIFDHRNSRWLALFVGLMFVSLIHADVTFNTFEVIKMVFGYLFLCFAVAKLVDSNERLKGFALTLVLSHVALVALNPDVVLRPEVRTYLQGVTFLGDGNDFGLSVVVAAPLCLYLFLDTDKKFYRLLALGLVGVMLFSIIGTSSRGASLAITAVFVYLWWRGRSKMLGLLAFVALGVALLIYAPDEYFGRMETIANYEEEGSAMGRIHAWKAALRMAGDHPVLGVAVGHFPIKYGVEYRPPEYAGLNMPWHTAHSIYFLVLGELGLPGIIFLLGILYGNYRSGERIIKRVRTIREHSTLARRYERTFLCLNSSLIGFAVGGAFLSALYYPHLYVISALYIAAELMYRRDEALMFPEHAPATDESAATVGQTA